jgi:hypothetical protein
MASAIALPVGAGFESLLNKRYFSAQYVHIIEKNVKQIPKGKSGAYKNDSISVLVNCGYFYDKSMDGPSKALKIIIVILISLTLSIFTIFSLDYNLISHIYFIKIVYIKQLS